MNGFCVSNRIDTLKNILVSLYGTSGSFWNRFANVETFEEINRLSREILIKTKDIVQENGFELLYADTDSVFLKKIGAPMKSTRMLRTSLQEKLEFRYPLNNITSLLFCYRLKLVKGWKP